MGLDHGFDQVIMTSQRCVHEAGCAFPQHGRSHDICHEERQESGRQLGAFGVAHGGHGVPPSPECCGGPDSAGNGTWFMVAVPKGRR